MTGSGSGVGGLTPSIEGAEADQFVPVEEDERQFGRYHLRYEIASGGMASVYLARSKGPAGFDRALAVKRIHPHLAKKKEFVEMFLDEARLSARITHPNVCSVFDFGEVDGTYYMAMEYLVGQPLSSLLRALNAQPAIATSPRWRALAAKIIADACEGLHAAHELTDERGKKLGVIHRDCSPHNIFVTYDGAVKVVDFGVAFAEGRLHHTQTGNLKGKLGYMSPEQVRGKSIDRRLDVWALGVCLWELLAVKRLFGKRQEVELISAVANEPIMPPSSVRAGVPPELDRIVMKALERDLDQRYTTTRAMARELNAFVSSSGVAAGLGDLSELMEELFAKERQAKLGVVASVLQTGSDALVVGSKSGQRMMADVTAAPLHAPAPTRAEAIVPTAIHAVADSAPLPATSASVGASAASSGAFAAAPPAETPRAGMPPWIWPAALGGVLFVALIGVVIVATTSPPAPEATPLPLLASSATSGAVPTTSVIAPLMAPPPTTLVTAAPATVVEAPPPTAATATVADTLPPAARAPRTGPGTIAISVSGGWADIYVDGELRGRTPRQLQVPSGRHDVELRPNGSGTGQHQTVNVRPGATSRVTAHLGG